MDDPNVTIEEYISLEKEKARRRGKLYNWETVTYGKIWDNEDVHDLGYVEIEFPSIVFNDTLTSEAALSCEPTHIDEFDLKDETSLSKCDEEEQNVLNFNDLFPFNVIYPNDSKSNKDNDDDKIDIEHSSGDMSVIPLSNVINVDVGAYAHGTDYTTYSLNEYSVYKYQYDVSWGMDTAYRLPIQF
ncbi:hypothetical protein Tco_0270725 [Tanacetum coccineum]